MIRRYDILEPFASGHFLPIWSKNLENIDSNIIGDWYLIDRQSTSLYPSSYPLGSKLDECDIITFFHNNVAAITCNYNPKRFWILDKKDNKEGYTEFFLKIFYEWEWKLCKSESHRHIHWGELIQFYNEEVLVTNDYLLVKKKQYSKFTDVASVLGMLAKFHIAGQWYVLKERAELLDKMKSKKKVNAYMEYHPENIVFRLAPRYDTLESRFWSFLNEIF